MTEEAEMLDAQRLDAPCATCATVAAVVRHTGRESACDCGRIYTPRWSDADDAPAPTVAPLAAARAAWPGVLRDLAAARLYARQEAARVPGGPADATGLLGRLQGRAGGATRDASESQVATMWGLLTRGVSERARAGFVAALVRHCEETTRPDTDAVDWDHARRCAERLRWLCARGEGRLLLALATELAEGASWRDGARLAADACAPGDLRAAWAARALEERGVIGRPRRDVAAPSAEQERVAWGEARLSEVVRVWIDGSIPRS